MALLGVLLVVSVVSYSLTMVSLTRDAGTAATAMASSILEWRLPACACKAWQHPVRAPPTKIG